MLTCGIDKTGEIEEESRRRERREKGENKGSIEKFITANQSPGSLFSLIMHMSCDTIRCAVEMLQN